MIGKYLPGGHAAAGRTAPPQPNRGPRGRATPLQPEEAPIVEIAPFRGLRYDPSRVDPDAVIAPPYDVVGEDDVAALHARSPWNIAHVEAPRGDDGRFEEAAEALRSWEADGVLLRDSAPALYAYEQRTRLEGDDGPRRVRRGYFARLRLSPFEAGEVLPHERTMAGPKAERLALLQATRTNVSPILVISSGDTDTASALLAGVASREPASRPRTAAATSTACG